MLPLIARWKLYMACSILLKDCQKSENATKTNFVWFWKNLNNFQKFNQIFIALNLWVWKNWRNAKKASISPHTVFSHHVCLTLRLLFHCLPPPTTATMSQHPNCKKLSAWSEFLFGHLYLHYHLCFVYTVFNNLKISISILFFAINRNHKFCLWLWI